MKDLKLTKLSSEDLSSICGGQIYKVCGEEIYVVPSAGCYTIHYNKTEAINNSGHLRRQDIVVRSNYSEAVSCAEADCTYYKIIKAWS